MKTSIRDNTLLWFGAAISIAEILSGTLFAPLGFGRGVAAILLGHLIGGVLMLGCGLIGASSRKPAMVATSFAFGDRGSQWFAGLNVLQLLGWTAVMILTGAQACQLFLPVSIGFWAAVIGAITVLWLLVGLQDLGKLNQVAMALLFLACLYLTIRLAGQHTGATPSGSLTFGAGMELAIAMPLSWLPLIADYTSTAAKPKAATGWSVAVYLLTSSWMYVIGLLGVLFTGKTSVAGIMQYFGLGVVALVVIVLSTITTTFLDVYSAGVSGKTLGLPGAVKWQAIGVTVLGTVIGIVVPLGLYENFLYLITAVFVPMAVIQIVDYLFAGTRRPNRAFDWVNLLLWLAGFLVYEFVLNHTPAIGSTIPTVVIVGLATALCSWLRTRHAQPTQ